MTDCTWDAPGADPYRGTPRAAIMAMSSIPEPARRQLVAKAEASKFDDVVMIRRDSIAGKHQYSPELSNMAFGKRGRVCESVTRAGWATGHVERAMVFCADSYCVARPQICNNWSMVSRIAPAPVAVAPPAEAMSGGGGAPISGPVAYPVAAASPSFEDEVYPPRTVYWPIFPSYVWPPVMWAPVYSPPVYVAPAIPTIPEPGGLALMMLGLAAVAWRSLARARG